MKIKLVKSIEPSIKFNSRQIIHRDFIFSSIQDGKLNIVNSTCFCGDIKSRTIFNYDSYGLNIPTVVCKFCSTIRSKFFLDDESLLKFYNEGYYYPHMLTETSSATFGMDFNQYYKLETRKGLDIYEFINKSISINNIKNVLEVGCGVGGILEIFNKKGLDVYGCDYSSNLIEFAKSKNPNANFRVGGPEAFKDKNFDLIILSDVVEHLTKPNIFLSNIRKRMNNSGHVYINCPNFFEIGLLRWNANIRQFFKLEHAFCYTPNSLNILMKITGFDCVKMDKYIRGVFKKKTNINVSVNKLQKDSFLHIILFIFYTNLKKIFLIKTKLSNVYIFLIKIIIFFKIKIKNLNSEY
jgi:SAM-dependent methyltransferase